MSPEEQEKVFEKLVKPPAKKSSKVTSADGFLTLNDQSIKKKLGQIVRSRANRTFTKNFTSASKETQPKATSTPLTARKVSNDVTIDKAPTPQKKKRGRPKKIQPVMEDVSIIPSADENSNPELTLN